MGTRSSSRARALIRPHDRGAAERSAGRCPCVDFLLRGQGGRQPHQTPVHSSEPRVTAGSKVRVWPAFWTPSPWQENNSASVLSARGAISVCTPRPGFAMGPSRMCSERPTFACPSCGIPGSSVPPSRPRAGPGLHPGARQAIHLHFTEAF